VDPGFVDEIVAESGGRADRVYFERLAAEAPAMVRWLQQLGVVFQSPPYYLAKGPGRIQPVGGGEAILRALLGAAKAAGVEFLYGRTAKRLLAGNNAGIGLEDGTTIAADAVVLASGGFEGNAAMMREHFGPGGDNMHLISPGTAFNNGDGIAMALAAGARRAGDWSGMHAEPVDARSRKSAPVVLVYPYGIVVDSSGSRFFDEGAGFVHETWETFARALHFSAPGRKAWAILDAALLDIEGYERAIRSEVPPVLASSIAELAKMIEVPADALEKTINAYNAACSGDASRFDAARKDGLASAPGLLPRKSNWARPLSRAPFHAWPLEGAIAYTFGGIETNAEAQVIGEGGPMRGLFAAGEITGHFYGTAPNAVAMLRALAFGRIAGRNALQ
jgi:tricarballylate dehydrogenase